MGEEENRTYSRVSTRIQGWMRLLPTPDSPPLFREGGLRSESPVLSARGMQLPEPLLLFLQELNDKLDMILGLLSRDQLQEQFPLRVEVLEVSGAGVQFRSQEARQDGECVEIVLVLDQLPMRLAGATGRIVRQLPPESDAPDMPVWALEFLRIREQDQDAVIQFVLQEERRRIREKRWG